MTEQDSILGSTSASATKQIEAFSRKVTTTATQLIGDPSRNPHYQYALHEIQKELRRPGLQQRVFSYAQASPTELVRSRLSTTEIQHRALTFLPDHILKDIPENDNAYSLFQGFQAALPDIEGDEGYSKNLSYQRNGTRRLLLDRDESQGITPLQKAKKDRKRLDRRLEMMSVRKNMCSSEIREIDKKIANMHNMRKIVMSRLEGLEQEEVQIEEDLLEADRKLEEMGEEDEPSPSPGANEAIAESVQGQLSPVRQGPAENSGFMSASIYEKLPSPRSKRTKPSRRKSLAVRHEHLEPGSSIAEFQAHSDMITSMDFDVPFGTMVTASLDDTIRVWDLNHTRCIGQLEGHQASVRCLQMEENIVATGSMDATIRLWDLDNVEYRPRQGRARQKTDEDTSETEGAENGTLQSSMADCHLHTLSAHVAEITALHFRGETLVSGSADKTLRQWDLTKGRCVQTLDVLWAAAQASSTIDPSAKSTNNIKPTGAQKQWQMPNTRTVDASADFVGALQCFDAALACGTADGMVRLWDLRSGQVHRSLVGHTGAITCLQFDEEVLVTGSADRSVRIWDLRTGSIRDAYAYDSPVTSMMFDTRNVVAAAGENVAKVYDKADGRHWDCGPGVGQNGTPNTINKLRVRDSYLIEGRKDGIVGIWSC